MNGKARVLAVAVVAMFCLTAVAVAEHADDSAAADDNYHIYVTFLDDDADVVHQIWIGFSSSKDKTAYAAAATNAIQSAIKDWDDIEGEATDYSLSLSGDMFWFKTPDVIYTAVASNDNGSWKYSEGKDYADVPSIGVTFYPQELHGYNGGHYFGVTKEETLDGVRYIEYINYEDVKNYDRAPDAGPNDYKNLTDYHLYLTILGSKASVLHQVWIDFSSTKDKYNYAEAVTNAIQQAMKDWDDIEGEATDYSLKWTGTMFWFKTPGVIYTAVASNDNGSWKYSEGTDYADVPSTGVTFYPQELNGYNGGHYFGVTKEQTLDGVNYIEYINFDRVKSYDRAPDAGPDDYKSDKKSDNTVLYIAVAVVAIIVILALAYYFLVMKKKNAVVRS